MAKKSSKPQAKPAQVSARKKAVKSTGAFSGGFWGRQLIPSAAIIILSFVLYGLSIGYDYVLDDQIVITKNEYTQKGVAGIWDIFSHESFQGYFGMQKKLVEGGRYRPLSIATFALERDIFGANNKAASHFINILLYALTGLMIFRIMNLLFPPGPGARWYWNIPFLTAILFIAHPVHSEVVANIKGRDEIMTLMGALGALYLILRYLSTGKKSLLVWSGISMFLALMAKENAIMFIAIIPMTVYFFTDTPFSKNLRSLIPVLIATVIYLIIRFRVVGFFTIGQEITDLMNNPFYGMSLGEKTATIFYTLLYYLKLSFYPHPLTHDYYPYKIPKLNWGDIRAIASLLVYVGLGAVAVVGFFRRSVVSYCILFFMITLFIVSNFVFPVGTFMNERFIFTSSVGFCLLVAWFVVKKLPELLKQDSTTVNMPGAALVGLFIVGLSVLTLIRIPDWESGYTLNASAIKTSPTSARANCFYGTAIFENKYLIEKDPVKKKEYLDTINKYINRAVEIYPDYSSALTMVSGVAAEYHKADHDLDKLLTSFRSLLHKRTHLPFIYEYLDYVNATDADKGKLKAFYQEACHHTIDEVKDYKRAIYYVDLYLQLTPPDMEAFQYADKLYKGAGIDFIITEYNDIVRNRTKVEPWNFLRFLENEKDLDRSKLFDFCMNSFDFCLDTEKNNGKASNYYSFASELDPSNPKVAAAATRLQAAVNASTKK